MHTISIFSLLTAHIHDKIELLIRGGEIMLDKRDELKEILLTLNEVADNLTIISDGIVSNDSIRKFLCDIDVGNVLGAYAAFSSIKSELIIGKNGSTPSRVSGSLLMDAVLEAILLKENPFSAMAAKGISDSPIFNAMENELRILEKFSTFSEEEFICLINEAIKFVNSSPQNGTYINVSSAKNTAYKNHEHYLSLSELSVKPTGTWEYGELKLNSDFYADDALSEMYRRFVITEGWSKLTESLWSFHATYGTGEFLKYRNFYFDGALHPLLKLKTKPYADFTVCEKFAGSSVAFETLQDNAIAFMQDESYENMLLIGPPKSGKTEMILHLLDELPKTRLVIVTGKCDKIVHLFEILASQPQRFLVFVDPLKQGILDGVIDSLVPDNVLLIACVDDNDYTAKMDSLFGLTVHNSMPIAFEPEIALSMLEIVLSGWKIDVDDDIIEDCIEKFNVNELNPFSVSDAVMAANNIKKRKQDK